MAEELPNCPACGTAATSADALWCEACGADFAGEHKPVDGPPCIECGALFSEIVDGWCGACGRKQPSPRDHMHETALGVAGLTDRGLRHHQNEDAMAVAASNGVLIGVVCDGVSSTDNPQDASLAAADAARDVLLAAADAETGDWELALAESIAAVRDAAAAVPELTNGQGAASTTIVAAVATATEQVVRLHVAWVGDSRAYWVDDEQATQLTADDSWAAMQVELGNMTADEAGTDPRAHSITRWLGADAGDTEPSIAVTEHDPGGRLLLCTDGLWNYAPTSQTMFDRIVEFDDPDHLDLARSLVAFANASGGQDNISVVIARPETLP
jgi:serine/threonine protein phosphatase PrpC